jgi:hypothetical protein
MNTQKLIQAVETYLYSDHNCMRDPECGLSVGFERAEEGGSHFACRLRRELEEALIEAKKMRIPMVAENE